MRELDLQKEVRRLLDKLQAFGVLMYTDTSRNGQRGDRMTSMDGFPDIEVIVPGARVGYMELKNPKGGRLRDKQMAFRERVKRFDVIWREVKSVDDAFAFLNEMGVKCQK
jgi:hypothetical protein